MSVSSLNVRSKQGRIHLRVDVKLLNKVKQYALDRGIPLTRIIESLFKRMLEEEGLLKGVRKTNDVEQI